MSDEFTKGFNLAISLAAEACDRRASILTEHLKVQTTNKAAESAVYFTQGVIAASKRNRQTILNLKPVK